MNISQADLENAVGALNAIPTPSERGEWWKISTAFKVATGGGQYEAWETWCKRGAGFNQTENKSTWDSIDTQGRITAKTLYGLAREHGWSPQGEQIPCNQSAFYATRHDYAEIMDRAGRGSGQTAFLDYIASRGFTWDTAETWKLGFIPRFTMAGTECDRLIIPYPGEKYYRARATGHCEPGTKYLCPPAKGTASRETGETWGGKPLFNSPRLYQGQEIVFVVEGELDCISLEQAGQPAVASNEGQLETELGKGGKAGVFVIVPDDDETGRAKAEKRLSALTSAHRTGIISPLPTGIHDVNDYLVKNAAGLKGWIAEQAELARQERKRKYAGLSACKGLESLLDDIGKAKANKPTPTGFLQMDREERLGGGLFPGLYVLGAISSLGKTTLALQISDQIARAGHDVLVFSLEMSKQELIAKSLSRLTTTTAKDPKDYKTTRGIMRGDKYARYNERELAGIQEAVDIYRQQIAPNMYIVEGDNMTSAEEIRSIAEDFSQHMGKSPVILVDYLQIIACPSEEKRSMTDKQVTDQAIVTLRCLARDLQTPVVVVSSLNRANYNVPISMEAFKESGAIEYSSDVLLGLQLQGAGTKGFDINTAKRETPRKLELVCLKNRNGAMGWKVPFDYDPRFNKFAEVSPFGVTFKS